MRKTNGIEHLAVAILSAVALGLAWGCSDRGAAQPTASKRSGGEESVRAVKTATLPAGTPIKLMLMEMLSTKTSKIGDPFLMALYDDVKIEGSEAVIPKGSKAAGKVVALKKFKQFSNAAGIGVELSVLILPDGTEVKLEAQKKKKGTNYFFTIENLDPPKPTPSELAKNSDASDLKKAMAEIMAGLTVPQQLGTQARDAQISLKKVFDVSELKKFYDENGGQRLKPIADAIAKDGLGGFLKNLSWKKADVIFTALTGVAELYNGYRKWVAKQERYIHPGAVLNAVVADAVEFTYTPSVAGASPFDP